MEMTQKISITFLGCSLNICVHHHPMPLLPVMFWMYCVGLSVKLSCFAHNNLLWTYNIMILGLDSMMLALPRLCSAAQKGRFLFWLGTQGQKMFLSKWKYMQRSNGRGGGQTFVHGSTWDNSWWSYPVSGHYWTCHHLSHWSLWIWLPKSVFVLFLSLWWNPKLNPNFHKRGNLILLLGQQV